MYIFVLELDSRIYGVVILMNNLGNYLEKVALIVY